ncbi:MAG: hypothetical protein ISN29_04985 [Gammaproteobacteria bacterium AqS3]|nr:hypothetical protein [Gammaproteobacteria bacterium AqS3]
MKMFKVCRAGHRDVIARYFARGEAERAVDAFMEAGRVLGEERRYQIFEVEERERGYIVELILVPSNEAWDPDETEPLDPSQFPTEDTAKRFIESKKAKYPDRVYAIREM